MTKAEANDNVPEIDMDRLVIEAVPLDDLKSAENNNKNHTPESTAKLAKSMASVGQIQPVIVDRDRVIIAGHGRVLAARELGWERIKCIALPVDHDTARRMRIADNLMVNHDYDHDALIGELKDLGMEDMDLLIGDDRMLDNLRIAMDPEGTMSDDSMVDDLDKAVGEFASETDEKMEEIEGKDVPVKTLLGFGALKPREARRVSIFMAMLGGRHGDNDPKENFMQHIEKVIDDG